MKHDVAFRGRSRSDVGRKCFFYAAFKWFIRVCRLTNGFVTSCIQNWWLVVF